MLALTQNFNCSSCTTSELFIRLTSCLTAIKTHDIKYCETFYRPFIVSKSLGEILKKVKFKGFFSS